MLESSSRKSEILKTCLEVEKGRKHIIECLKMELNRSKSFIHKVCETPLVELIKLAVEETDEGDMVFRKTDEQGNTPLIRQAAIRSEDLLRDHESLLISLSINCDLIHGSFWLSSYSFHCFFFLLNSEQSKHSSLM